MTRRRLIMLLGSAAAVWPLAARAQLPKRMRRIGVLMNIAADDPEAPVRVAAFAQGLQELGWTIGLNVRIDYRWGAGDIIRYRRHAEELIGLAPEVVLALGAAASGAVLQASASMPIVFVSAIDPVGAGNRREFTGSPAFAGDDNCYYACDDRTENR